MVLPTKKEVPEVVGIIPLGEYLNKQHASGLYYTDIQPIPRLYL